MKIAVGSTNPVKIEATKRAFEKAFGKCEVEGVAEGSEVSGVSSIPFGFDEIIKGAKNRAKVAIEKSGADYGVGLEGGFEETSCGTFMAGFVAIVNKAGEWGIGRGGGILVPEVIARKVKQGQELGVVMDKMLGTKNIKHQEGTTGYLTKNIITRTESFETQVVMALARFLRPELYGKKKS